MKTFIYSMGLDLIFNAIDRATAEKMLNDEEQLLPIVEQAVLKQSYSLEYAGQREAKATLGQRDLMILGYSMEETKNEIVFKRETQKDVLSVPVTITFNKVLQVVEAREGFDALPLNTKEMNAINEIVKELGWED